jgi:alpha-beta hydrolase superfamily lysophospholipase
VTKPSGSKEFFDKAGSDDKTLKLYEGHFHDLLADIGKEQVMADIQAWIDAHIATEDTARPPRAAPPWKSDAPSAHQEP